MTCNLKLNLDMMKLFLCMSLLAFLTLAGCKNRNKQEVSSAAETRPAVFQTPAVVSWAKDAVLYEVNIRQYTPEGTFIAFAQHLPRLKELGADILWIMPIQPISEKNRKGTLGSYYAVQDYRKVNPEFGTMEDFKALVSKAHSMGFKVILDWVANHTGWDNWLLVEHGEWYTRVNDSVVAPIADWTDVADLNYEQPGLRHYMLESMKYWVREADIDGYRCDVAAMVPTDFWEQARRALDSIKPVFMLAEAWEPELTAGAFDACYAWDLLHTMNDIAAGKKTAAVLSDYIRRTDSLYLPRTILMNFLTNHDENSWNGTIGERLGDLQKAFAVLTYTLPGMPLIYSGQEAGLNHRLEFFEKDEIKWADDRKLTDFYTRLDRLKHENPALWAGTDAGRMKVLAQTAPEQVFAFTRTKGDNELLVVLNLSREKVAFKFDGTLSASYRDAFTGEEVQLPAVWNLPPAGYRVLLKNTETGPSGKR